MFCRSEESTGEVIEETVRGSEDTAKAVVDAAAVPVGLLGAGRFSESWAVLGRSILAGIALPEKPLESPGELEPMSVTKSLEDPCDTKELSLEIVLLLVTCSAGEMALGVAESLELPLEFVKI